MGVTAQLSDLLVECPPRDHTTTSPAGDLGSNVGDKFHILQGVILVFRDTFNVLKFEKCHHYGRGSSPVLYPCLSPSILPTDTTS